MGGNGRDNVRMEHRGRLVGAADFVHLLDLKRKAILGEHVIGFALFPLAAPSMGLAFGELCSAVPTG